MFVWCAILFVLGILAFVDSLLNMGEIFRQVNSVLFMLLSLALLFRTTSKMKQHKKEQYEDRVFHLEQQVKMLQAGREKLKEF